MTAIERRGLELFKDSCSGCHQLFRPGEDARTVSSRELERRLLRGAATLTSPGRHDVGTPVLGEAGNNPPSLRNVWAAAPYFSDGSATSLEAVLERTNPRAAKIHAPENLDVAPGFSPSERAALLAFLRAL